MDPKVVSKVGQEWVITEEDVRLTIVIRNSID